jgi:hypothetical protein
VVWAGNGRGTTGQRVERRRLRGGRCDERGGWWEKSLLTGAGGREGEAAATRTSATVEGRARSGDWQRRSSPATGGPNPNWR